MDYNEKEKLAQIYGKAAAERGFEFHPMYDTHFDELLVVATCDADRTANNALIRHWQSGYSEFCRSLKLGGSDTYEVIMIDHTVLRGAEPTRGLVYWDWMDGLSTLAAAAEYAVGHWSLFHCETYVDRHCDTNEEFARILNILTGENHEDSFLGSLQQLVAESKPADLASPVQQPEVVSRHYSIDKGWPPLPGLLFWNWMNELSVIAIYAEWKANHLTWHQISAYCARHPAVVESFNQRYNQYL